MSSPTNFVDLTGQTFGRWTVVRRGEDKVSATGRRNVRWVCRCTCGNEMQVQGSNLKSGCSKSCGCLRRQRYSSRTFGGNPNWKGDRIKYATAHQRVYAAKGPASAHACVDCGAQAAEWSYMYGCPREMVTDDNDGSPNGLAYSPDPDFYAPRCAPCHRKFDLSQAA